MSFDPDDGFRCSGLANVRAFVVFGESVVDAVYAAAVSAHVGDEFFRPADGAAFHDCPVIVCLPT